MKSTLGRSGRRRHGAKRCPGNGPSPPVIVVVTYVQLFSHRPSMKDQHAEGLIGHGGAVLLRKLADQCGLTSALGAALARAGKFPLIDRGMALVSMAVAIAHQIGHGVCGSPPSLMFTVQLPELSEKLSSLTPR